MKESGLRRDESDVNVLDDVYRTYLRPTLDGLDSMFAPMTSLFHTSHQIPYVAVGNSESNSSGFFMTERWERTKSKYIVGQGFKLGSDRLLKLWHEYHFNGYTGIGGNEFDLVLTVEWKLARETVSQDVMVNGMPIPDLAAIVPYSELDTKSAELGHTIAEISNLMMTLIDALSSGLGNVSPAEARSSPQRSSTISGTDTSPLSRMCKDMGRSTRNQVC